MPDRANFESISGSLFLRSVSNTRVHIKQCCTSAICGILDFASRNFTNGGLSAFAALSHCRLRNSGFRQIGDDFFPVHAPILSEFR